MWCCRGGWRLTDCRKSGRVEEEVVVALLDFSLFVVGRDSPIIDGRFQKLTNCKSRLPRLHNSVSLFYSPPIRLHKISIVHISFSSTYILRVYLHFRKHGRTVLQLPLFQAARCYFVPTVPPRLAPYILRCRHIIVLNGRRSCHFPLLVCIFLPTNSIIIVIPSHPLHPSLPRGTGSPRLNGMVRRVFVPTHPSIHPPII